MVEELVLSGMALGDLFAYAEQVKQEQGAPAGAELHKRWIAINADSPLLYAAYFNYSVALAGAGDQYGAINAARECIRLKPDFYSAYINCGRLLEDAGQAGDAVVQWLELVERLAVVNGDNVKQKLTAFHQIGRVLAGHQKGASAEDALRQALEINPNQREFIEQWIHLRLGQCKWPVVAPSEHVPADVLFKHISPLSLATLRDDPAFQLARASNYARDAIKLVDPRLKAKLRQQWRRRGEGERKLRIGYVSSDLREHAVGFAMTDVIETHDRSRFEILAYYCGIPRPDATRSRIEQAADRWTDIRTMSDEQVAETIARDQIDILIDLNGHTKDARTRVFGYRPAPINVNWFGFPGTMGTPYHHYLIADDIIIPEQYEIYYSETVKRLPCYQPNDRKKTVAARSPARRDEGLPDDAFVFCSLNGVQKITPALFDRWLRILAQTPGSVLWLLSDVEETNQRLRSVAAQAGIGAERLIFAGRKSNPEHLARYVLADLFLDNSPYGAHTTAADALWMGVPILTVPGKSFAARVCASLVTAAGLPEMVCATEEDYVARAIALTRDGAKLRAMKQALLAGRQTSLLFDTPRLVSGLEDLYLGMWRDYENDALPSPDLRNIDAYQEVGVEFCLRGAIPFGHADYLAAYRELLAERDEAWTIAPDDRLWRR